MRLLAFAYMLSATAIAVVLAFLGAFRCDEGCRGQPWSGQRDAVQWDVMPLLGLALFISGVALVVGVWTVRIRLQLGGLAIFAAVGVILAAIVHGDTGPLTVAEANWVWLIATLAIGCLATAVQAQRSASP